METTSTAVKPESISTAFTRKLVEDWVNSCNDFLRWQREEVIEQKPAPEKLSEHRDALKVMLRLGRSFHAQLSDPDFPLQSLAAEVAGKLGQLEKSWKMIYDPINDGEADGILQLAFPDEPRTGIPA